jgi:hypothetical protein
LLVASAAFWMNAIVNGDWERCLRKLLHFL